MKTLKQKIRHWIIRHLTNKLLKAVTEDDILTISGVDWLIHRRKLSREEILDLREEAEWFKKSTLWRYMKRDVEFQAFEQMAPKATVPEDLIFGKAMFYNLSLQERYLENLAKK